MDAPVARCCTSPGIADPAHGTISAAIGHSEQADQPNRQPPAHGRQDDKTPATAGTTMAALAITNQPGAVGDRACSPTD